SGGMQQRAMMAMALAGHPDLLVADEPTTALDVTIQAQILDLIRKLRDEISMSVVLVTHNLGIVSEVADNVIVMYAGHIVEKGDTAGVISNPAHPYTRALLAAVPRFGSEMKKLSTIAGNVPPPSKYPKGCRFFGRCPLAEKLSNSERSKCEKEVPKLIEKVGRSCRCHFSK
ncbi:MAG TPA: ABC transporter ATP-binding protein, partial [Victivallales bacterium]|nr:ABC transporter ATP-binding protein [Victivallales bacterium]